MAWPNLLHSFVLVPKDKVTNVCDDVISEIIRPARAYICMYVLFQIVSILNLYFLFHLHALDYLRLFMCHKLVTY